MKQIQLNFIVPATLAGKRLDQALAHLLPDYSRSRIQTWIANEMVKVNGLSLRAKDKLLGYEQIAIEAYADKMPETWQAEAIDLNIIYEDSHILVVNKPAGLVVHPAVGNYQGTLLNALLHHVPTLADLPRAGIVHRLDKETSGLLVVAKTLLAHTDLVRQLQARTVKRQYEAIALGQVLNANTIAEPIGRHPKDRKRMAVVNSGKPAVTHYRVLQNFQHYSHLQVNLETGRTHQIRVHFAHIKHALVGDPVYGKEIKPAKNLSPRLQQVLGTFKRQALHARRLGLIHPDSLLPVEWEAPLPVDMQDLLQALQDDFPSHSI
jgi:23S rRNA pseudouridine1911/1915/1917 synthase